jgi:hypothetical protein
LFSSSVPLTMTNSQYLYEIRPRKDKHGVDLFSMRCRSVGCGTVSRMTPSGMPSSAERSHQAVIRVYDEAGNVIETHEHVGQHAQLY